MSNLSGYYDENDEPVSFEAIPAGKYLALITNSEMKTTSAGNGKYLELTFQVIEGEYKGRNLWSRLNLENPSEKAVKIARGELASIRRAVGVMNPKDSVELHNLPMVINVKCVKRDDTGDITNEINGYSKKESATGQPQQSQSDDPPWARKG